MAEGDEKFMSIALACAARGRGRVEPNPMVGAVIVRDGAEIGRGWHRRFGGPHAEVEAIRAAEAAGNPVRGATVYVSLEPCCHHGKKTPPCTDAMIAAGVARVIVAMEDPDPNVSGRGLLALRRAGIETTCGVMGAEAGRLLRAYVKLRTAGRPWVICKWAQTADGWLALPPGAGRWISGQASRRQAQKLRGLCDGVLVGVGTILSDDPLLTNRSGKGKRAARVVLDSNLRTPPDARIVKTAGQSPVIVATTPAGRARKAARAKQLGLRGVEVLTVNAAGAGVDLVELLNELGRRQWTWLLVEGGAKVLGSFVRARLADELVVFVSPRRVDPAPDGLPRFDIADVRKDLSPSLIEERASGADRMLRYDLSGAPKAER